MADMPNREVTLREMVEAMSHYPDDATFRWFTVNNDTAIRLTFGQVRRELNELSNFRLQAAFDASPAELGRAAVEAALNGAHAFQPALEGESCKVCICNREIGDTIHEPLGPG